MNASIQHRLQASTERYYRDVLGLPDWSSRTQQRLTRAFERTMFERLSQHVGSLAGKVVLDLGCGWGGVVVHAARTADYVVGIEPDRERLQIATMIVTASGCDNIELLDATGEAMPFPDNQFDVVASYQVLEHVHDPSAVIGQVHRVLKPGGVFHFNTPNYMFCREPHYKLAWLPLMPKPLARCYLRLRGRNPEFINHIQYVHPLGVRARLRRAGFSIIDVHERRVRRKLEERTARIVERMPGSRVMRRVTDTLLNVIAFAYVLFLNQDQEYVARKAIAS